MTAQCPSAPPDWPGAKIFGIVAGTPDHPLVHYLKVAEPVTDTSFDDIAPVTPREAYRIAADCNTHGGCQHWTGSACSLARRVVAQLTPVVVERRLPHCDLRSTCRWWHQEGRAACDRCPEIATDMVRASDRLPPVEYF